MLSIKNLTIQIDDKEILNNVSFDFESGKVYAIMGVNGSGKSSLAKSLMGNEDISITNGSIAINTENINSLKPNERAVLGIFLSPQSPIALPGVTVGQLLRTAIPREQMDSKELTAKLKSVAKKLQIPSELLTRSLNQNFSGGERKKMEVLQVAILDPKYIILDEIDTGVDIDALGIIANFLNEFIKNSDKTLILITHYNRILSYLNVDNVLVMKSGTIVETGNAALATQIEKDGYDK